MAVDGAGSGLVAATRPRRRWRGTGREHRPDAADQGEGLRPTSWSAPTSGTSAAASSSRTATVGLWARHHLQPTVGGTRSGARSAGWAWANSATASANGRPASREVPPASSLGRGTLHAGVVALEQRTVGDDAGSSRSRPHLGQDHASAAPPPSHPPWPACRLVRSALGSGSNWTVRLPRNNDRTRSAANCVSADGCGRAVSGHT